MYKIPHFLDIYIDSVRSWTTTSIIIFHVLPTLSKPFLPLTDNWIFHSFFPHKPRRALRKWHLHSFLISQKNLMLICCSRNRSFIFATRRINTRLINDITSTQLASMRWNCNRCNLKHAQACLYYDQAARLPSICTIKPFLELYSQAMYSNPIEQIPWEDNSCSASLKFPAFFGTWRFTRLFTRELSLVYLNVWNFS
jgi:hypothetical protein